MFLLQMRMKMFIKLTSNSTHCWRNTNIVYDMVIIFPDTSKRFRRDSCGLSMFQGVDRTIVAKATELTEHQLLFVEWNRSVIDNIKYVISACQIIYLPCSEIKLHNWSRYLAHETLAWFGYFWISMVPGTCCLCENVSHWFFALYHDRSTCNR